MDNVGFLIPSSSSTSNILMICSGFITMPLYGIGNGVGFNGMINSSIPLL